MFTQWLWTIYNNLYALWIPPISIGLSPRFLSEFPPWGQYGEVHHYEGSHQRSEGTAPRCWIPLVEATYWWVSAAGLSWCEEATTCPGVSVSKENFSTATVQPLFDLSWWFDQVALRLISRGKHVSTWDKKTSAGRVLTDGSDGIPEVRPGQEIGYVICNADGSDGSKDLLAERARHPHELEMDRGPQWFVWKWWENMGKLENPVVYHHVSYQNI